MSVRFDKNNNTMDIFTVKMENGSGKESSFTTRAKDMNEAETLAGKEYPRLIVTKVENETTGETKTF